MVGLFADQVVSVTSSRFFVDTKRFLTIYVHKLKYNFITPNADDVIPDWGDLRGANVPYMIVFFNPASRLVNLCCTRSAVSYCCLPIQPFSHIW